MQFPESEFVHTLLTLTKEKSEAKQSKIKPNQTKKHIENLR